VASEFTTGDIDELRMTIVRFFGAINDHADVVLDLDETMQSRVRALSKLRRALQPFTRPGRPQNKTGHRNGPLVEDLRTISLRLFSELNKCADVAASQSVEARVAAQDRLQRAIRSLLPPGRPLEITDMDVARDAPAIARLHEQFISLMTEAEAGAPGTEAAELAVALIRQALDGECGSRDLVQRCAADFLGAPLELAPHEVERLLDHLKLIKRPSQRKTFLIRALAAKYQVEPAAAATTVRRMMHPQD
jgi:hypothetical protein